MNHSYCTTAPSLFLSLSLSLSRSLRLSARLSLSPCVCVSVYVCMCLSFCLLNHFSRIASRAIPTWSTRRSSTISPSVCFSLAHTHSVSRSLGLSVRLSLPICVYMGVCECMCVCLSVCRIASRAIPTWLHAGPQPSLINPSKAQNLRLMGRAGERVEFIGKLLGFTEI